MKAIRFSLGLMLAVWPIVGISAKKYSRIDLGSDELTRYFENRVAALEKPLSGVKTEADWETRKDELRRQLREMLGLDPLPERTALKAVVTGRIEGEGYTVEKLHFQSRPGLYVTANLYVPDEAKNKPAPAILYVCGHARVRIGGISYGNKSNYHYHGVWFARNGYVCLAIDTLQLGEIEGIHHGTYRHDRWWWNARGYTPAGVEAWNGIRALDYLESRPEVDKSRLGISGRSGGGAYSWWVSALDDRIKAAVPVAGITSLRNHVVDGCIEGHCDCMYPVNTYCWDFAKVAALVSPRALLISNTDKDTIFPLDGVTDLYFQTRRIYELQGAGAKLGLNIEEGPHKDTQPLRTSAFHWFNRHLKGAKLGDTFSMAAAKVLDPKLLKVFDKVPADEKNTTIDETFVPVAEAPQPPDSQESWKEMRDGWMKQLSRKSFRGWPDLAVKPALKRVFEGSRDGVKMEVFELTSEPDVTCHLHLVRREGLKLGELETLELHVLSEADWARHLSGLPTLFPDAFPSVELPGPNQEQLEAQLRVFGKSKLGAAFLCPRGIGPKPWPADERKRIQIRRRFVLIGQTLDAMRTWDIRQAARALREGELRAVPMEIRARGTIAGNALYASLFLDPAPRKLQLEGLPKSHHEGPFYLNVLRFLDLPQAVAMAAERSSVRLFTGDPNAWDFSIQVSKNLGWRERQLEVLKSGGAGS